MTRRSRSHRSRFGAGIVFVAMACFVAFGGSCSDASEVAREPSHVLVLTLDTTRWDRCGFNGYRPKGWSPTPNLDRLASEGRAYPEAFASVPLTLPSHVGMFTGLEPFEHGVRENLGFALASKNQRKFDTLAESAAAAGHQTAAFVSGETLNHEFGLGAGFATYSDLSAVNTQGGLALDERSADQTSDAAMAWLKTADPQSSSLLWVHYFDPHRPWVDRGELTREARDAGAGPYEGEIAFMDREIGRLLEVYRERGFLKNALVIVLADHGEGLGEHGEETHGLLVHDATIRIPFILRAARGADHPECAHGVSANDVMPTALAWLGLKARQSGHTAGRDLLNAKADRPRPHYAESVYAWRQCGWAPSKSYRESDLKTTRSGNEQTLFDWRSDSEETIDLASDRLVDQKRLQSALRDYRAQRSEKGFATDGRLENPTAGAAYLATADAGVPAEPPLRVELGLPAPSERMRVYVALERLRPALDRLKSEGGPSAIASEIEAQSLLAVLDREARSDNPSAQFWRARARLILATAQVGEYPRGHRMKLLKEAALGYEAYGKLRPRDPRSFDQRHLVHLEMFGLEKNREHLRAIESDHQRQDGLGLATALSFALRAEARRLEGRHGDALKDARRALELDKGSSRFQKLVRELTPEGGS